MRILLISALRDEGPHVLEWIAHHRAIGVTDFLLYTNDCSDGTDEMLAALSDFGVNHFDNRVPPRKSVQWTALKSGWNHPVRSEVDWVMVIDSDEFVNLRAPLETLEDLINAAGEPDAILLPWRLFGSNGQVRLTDALTTETFNRAAPEGCNYPIAARQFKTLFRADGPFRQIGVHRPRVKRNTLTRFVDGSGNPMPEAFATDDARITLFGLPTASDLVQLNHYSVRSAESFMVKRQRGLPNRRSKPLDMNYWIERNFNVVEDKSIHRMRDGMLAALAELKAVDGVTALHEAALEHHHQAFEQLLIDSEEVRLYGRLLLAASSVPLPNSLIRDLAARYAASVG